MRERLGSKTDEVCRKFGIMLNEELFDAYRLHSFVVFVCRCSAEDQCGPGITVLWVLEFCFLGTGQNISPSRNHYISITTLAHEKHIYTHARLGYVPIIPVSYW
jgi:hypothetical protein